SATYVASLSPGDLTLHTSYKWQDKVIYRPEALIDDSVTTQAFGLWDARGSFKPNAAEDLEVALFVKNIANKSYFTGYLPFDTSFGYNIGFAGDPRTYGIELCKAFGGG